VVRVLEAISRFAELLGSFWVDACGSLDLGELLVVVGGNEESMVEGRKNWSVDDGGIEVVGKDWRGCGGD